MIRGVQVGLVLAAIGVVVAALAAPQGSPAPPPLAPHVEGEVIVKFRPETSPGERNALRGELGIVEVQPLHSIRAEHTVIRGMTVAEALERYANDPRIEYIEPNYILRAQVLPNDSNFAVQWALHNVGQTGGNPGSDVMAAEAWDISTGSDDVIVAVIDSGIDYEHPDLADNVFVNEGEFPGNGLDDDNNGYVDDVRGWNFVSQTNDPLDDNGHGSHVSGIAGAVGNNGIGISGVAWRVKIMPLKFLNSGGLGASAGAVAAIHYASMMGADVITAAWGGGAPSQAMVDAIRAAGEAEIVFVAAAGNGSPGVNIDLQPFLPASYELDNIISVAASDDRDRLWTGSNYGPGTVDVAAPGVSIFSTVPQGGYAFLNGTSMAVPHVAGVVALMRSRFPEMSAVDTRALLLDRADRVNPLVGLVAGGRRLNAFLPIATADSTPPAPIDTLSTFNPESHRIDLSWIATGDDGDEGTATRYEIRYSEQPIDADNFDLAAEVDDVPAPRPAGSEEQFRVEGLDASTTYYFAVRAFDEFGNGSDLSNVAIGVTAGPPSISASPESFSAELFTGQTATRTLRIDNLGVGEYVYGIEVQRPDTAPAIEAPFTLTAQSVAPPPAVPATHPYGPPYVPPDDTAPPADEPVAAGIADGLRILILQSNADVEVIKGALSVMDDVAFVDDLNVQLTAPSLADLEPFDAVIFVANNPVADQVTVGNVLADYADGGGGVVMTLASLIAGWEVRGRFLDEGYYPIELGTGPIGAASLGEYDANHPIMLGVDEASGDLLGDVELAPGAELVASWNNGEPFVVTKRGNIAAVNAYVAGNGFWGGDIPRLLRNAAFYTSNTIDWLSAAPASGTVPAGQGIDIEVTFDANGLSGGTYIGELVLVGNDPDNPIIRLPADLTVTGAPDLAVLPGSLDFGSLFIGDSLTRFLLLQNTGTEVANVSEIASDHPDFTIGGTSVELVPGQQAQLAVTFRPTSDGALAANLSFTSNDPDEPLQIVTLIGVGLVPPRIRVEPDSFSAELFTGQVASDTLVITNDGGSQLDVGIAALISTPAAAAVLPATAGPLPLVTAEPEPAGDAGPPGRLEDLSQRATTAAVLGEPFEFFEDFEDGLLDGWNQEQNINIKEVTDEFGANGTSFSYHQINFTQGHFTGIARSFGEQEPSYVGFYVRSSSTTTNDGYFLLRAINGLEAIFFFARDSGVFYCNLDVGGNSSVPYQADTWYFIEFRNIDFDNRTFDYWVNGALIQEAIPMRDTGPEREFWEVDLYNFDDDAEAWWDEIVISDEAPQQPVEAGPQRLSLAPGESADVTVLFNAAGQPGGQILANLQVTSNDPVEPQLLVPITLTITSAADIELSETQLDWGSVFIGQGATRTIEVANTGFEILTVSGLAVDDPAFSLDDPSGFVLAPDESRELTLTFAPTDPGVRSAKLTVQSDDLDEGVVEVALTGEGLLPPVIGVAPTEFQQQLFTGELAGQPMTVTNSGGSELRFTVRVELPDAPVDLQGVSAGPIGLAPGPVDLGGLQATGLPFSFYDGFEDGDFDGWIDAGGPAIKRVTDETAANGTVYSYQEFNAAGGHFTGIYRPLPNTRPVYVGFYVRSGSTVTPDAYFALRDANTFEGIFFFAGPDGNFGINSNVGGNQSVPYEAFTWYHIEFKQIDWDTKTFDYYVNGQLIQERIPFRNPSLIGGFSLLDLYSFQPGATAWWDEITLSTVEPPSPVSVSPIEGIVPAGESLELTVNFNAKNLAGGSYPAEILVESNDPETPLVSGSAELEVIEAPDIEVAPDQLDFQPLFIGLSEEQHLTVLNDGVAPLTVTKLSVDELDFSLDTTGFTLEPGQPRNLTIRFAPSREGPIAGTLTLTSNDPDEPLQTVPLSGEGRLPPRIGVAPEHIAIQLFTGQTALETLTLSNTGSSVLQWTAEFPDEAQPGWVSFEPDDGSVDPDGTAEIQVTFDAAGLSSAEFETAIFIDSNDPQTPRVMVPIALVVTAAADLRLSETMLEFGDVFLETSRNRRLIVSNDGVEDLAVSGIAVDSTDFAVSTDGFAVPPGGAAEIVVTFTPPGLGEFGATLSFKTNDPDSGSVSVPLHATGAIAPEAAVDPLSLSEALMAGERSVQQLTLSNDGGSDLSFDIEVRARLELGAAVPAGEPVEPAPVLEGIPALLDPAETAGPIGPVASGGPVAQDGAVFLADDFEDGDFEGWEVGPGEGVRFVTDQTAADESSYSYHETQSTVGHLDGIYQVFGPARPGYIGFWVRPGDTAAEDAYVVIHDSAGREVIWFFARSTGRLYLNADVGGNQLVIYNKDTWYFIEFRNINFQTQRFDYYINRQRVQANIPFRNFGGVDDMARIDLYNFTPGAEAWWDEIVIADEKPFSAVRVAPESGVVPPGGQSQLEVQFDARGLFGGSYPGEIVIHTNDPDRPELVVPTDLEVTGIPVIGVTPDHGLNFEAVRVGLPESRSLTFTNFGTDRLEVTNIEIPHPEFSANRTSFALAPQQSTAVVVTFAPESPGLRTTELFVSSNDPERREVVVDLSGVGIIAARLEVDPGRVDEVRYTGQMSTREVTLDNLGGEALDYTISLEQLSAATIPDEVTVFLEDFEPDDTGWRSVTYSEEDLWHRTEAHSNSPTHSWWCSQADLGHYGTPYRISNALISRPIDLRDVPTPISLTFWEDYETEPGWDKCMVDVSIDRGVSWIPLRGDYDTAPSGSTEGWRLESLDLSPFAGGIVQVRFYFETLDATNNGFSGWRVDDVRVRTVGPPWLEASPLEGSIPGGGSESLLVTFNALAGRPVGAYEASIDISSNDPGHPLVQVPATLLVQAPPRIALPGEPVTLASTLDVQDEETRHSFPVAVPPAFDGSVILSAAGDYSSPDRTATLIAEAFVLGSAGNTGTVCESASREFALSPNQLARLAADGVIEMDVRDSAAVGPCAVNSHALELHYRGGLERLDLGSAAVGASVTVPLEIANAGDGELAIHGIGSNVSGVSASPETLTIAARSTTTVEVTFAPTAAGEVQGMLHVDSNDPLTGRLVLPLTGEALQEPAVAAIAPAALTAALPPHSERTRTKSVRLSNTGQAALSFQAAAAELATVDPAMGAIPAGDHLDLAVTFASDGLDAGEYTTTLVIESNAVGGPIEVPLTLRVLETELTRIKVDFTPRFTDREDTVEISLELEPGYDPHDVRIGSMSLNDCMGAETAPVSFADLDRDGTPELVTQFDLERFEECMPRADPDGIRVVHVVGEIEDQAWFTGTAYLRGVVQIEP